MLEKSKIVGTLHVAIRSGPICDSKGQLILKQNCRAITSPKKRTKLIILSIFSSQDSELRSSFGRSYGSTILFRDLLTFNCVDPTQYSEARGIFEQKRSERRSNSIKS